MSTFNSQSHTKAEAVVKILFIDQQRCWTSAHFGTNMCFIPQKVTIKIAIENKRLMHNVQDFDCQRREKKNQSCLSDGFYISRYE